MMKYLFVSVVSALFFSSCGEGKRMTNAQTMNDDFSIIDMILAEIVPTGIVCDEWLIVDNSILCKTEERIGFLTKILDDVILNSPKIFYTSVAVLDDSIYLLSQKNVNIKNETGC